MTAGLIQFSCLITGIVLAAGSTMAVALPVPADFVENGISVITYAGALSQPVDGQDSILRRFEVQLMAGPANRFFHVLDDVRSGCPWPDSYGLIPMVGDAAGVEPHLLYQYDGNPYSIGLPPLVLNLPDQIAPDTTWDQSGWNMTVLERRRVDGVDCWLVEASERRGRRQTLTAEATNGYLLRAQADVFMGQGDRFRLTLDRATSVSVADESAATLSKLQEGVLELQKALNRRPDSQQSELSARQIETAVGYRTALHELAAGTALQNLVKRISDDVERQQKRVTAVADRAGQLMHSAAPEFSLNLINGGSIESQSLKGKVVVLHFWDYRDQPLAEPYGQTGYLDFVFNQRRKANVQVIGISTSPDFQQSDTLSRAKRSSRKLSEFMNLTYPVAYDDGALLRTLGDPRDSSGQLPLWIVLSSDGKIAHYHAGFYEIDTARGLKELDAVLAEQIRKAAP